MFIQIVTNLYVHVFVCAGVVFFSYVNLAVPGPCSDWCVDILPRRDWIQLEDPPIKRRLECYSGRGPRVSPHHPAVVLW